MPLLPPLLLAVLLVFQSSASSSSNSITFDETFYAGCAEDTALQRRLHPMLASAGTAPLPVLANYLLPAWWMEKTPRPNCWDPGPNDRWLVGKARLSNAVLSGVTMMLLVYAWLYRRRGLWAATTGASLVTFSPLVLAHASLAATDAMFATVVLGTLAVLTWHARAPSPLRLLALAVACGVAGATKYSAVFLLPTVAIVLLIAGRYSGVRRPGSSDPGSRIPDPGAGVLAARPWLTTMFWVGAQLAVLVPVALVVTLGLHGFVSDGPSVLRHPRFAYYAVSGSSLIDGFMSQVAHNNAGHPAFLLGEVSRLGWWYYYPFVCLVKSTPAEWLTAVVVLAALVRGKLWAAGRSRVLDISVLTWVVSGSVYLGLLLLSHVDTGQRFALPLYPLLFLLGVDQLWKVTDGRRALRQGGAALLVAVQVVSALSIAPLYLSYFTPVLGPANGWRLLADSNVDWGQDLIRLHDTLQTAPGRRVLMAYFGTASPAAYGIDSERWQPGRGQSVSDYDVLAVSITQLHGLYLENDPFRGLRAIPPTARAGYSIFLYDLRDPAVREALAEFDK